MYVFHPCDVASPAQLHLKQDGLYWAGSLPWALLLLTRSLAIWCHWWSASSFGETAQVAWSASDRKPRSLHRTGGWERRWLCILGSVWRGGASDSAILSLTKELLALDKRFSRSLLTVASLEMTLPRYVKYSAAFRLLPLMLIWRGLYVSRGGDWYSTSFFVRLKVRPKFLAALETQLTMCCRTSSVWARRGVSSANSSWVMSSSMVFVRVHPCLTLLGMGKLPESNLLCFTCLCWPSWSWRRIVRNVGGQPRGAKIFHGPSRLTVSKAFGLLYESCI